MKNTTPGKSTNNLYHLLYTHLRHIITIVAQGECPINFPALDVTAAR